MNVTRPSAGRTPRVSGLAASCSSAPQRSASPRVMLVGERLGQQRRHRSRRSLAEQPSRSVLGAAVPAPARLRLGASSPSRELVSAIVRASTSSVCP